MACCDAPCCPPACTTPCPPPPHPVCCMPCPPPLVLPTIPEPVKPLMLPVEKCECALGQENDDSKEKDLDMGNFDRVGNFYNNYNVDYRDQSRWKHTIPLEREIYRPGFYNGVTMDGQPTCCCCANLCQSKEKNGGYAPGEKKCEKGYQPCTLKLIPPPDGHPYSSWCAEIKFGKKSKNNKAKKPKNLGDPEQCRRPCCKHWKTKEGECRYDLPCKAACFNHPPGMKPKYHVPEIDHELLKALGESIKAQK